MQLATASSTFGLPALIAFGLVAAPGCAFAQRHDDFQLWSGASASTAVGAHAEARVDTLLTFDDGGSRPARQLVRVVALAKLTADLKIGGGFVWTHVDTDGAEINERRAVQEISWQTSAGAPTQFTSRTQIEERWRDGRPGVSVRLRQRTRLQHSLAKAASLIAWDETFFELRRTSWAGGSGPSAMLNFAGVHLPVSRTVSLEPGYLNQIQFAAGRDPVAHAAAVFVQLRF